MTNLDLEQISKVHDLSQRVAEGKEAQSEIEKICRKSSQKNIYAYMHRMLPVKVVYKNKVYTGWTSMTVISLLSDKSPSVIYQTLRRRGVWKYAVNDLHVYIDEKMDIKEDNIKQLFKNKDN